MLLASWQSVYCGAAGLHVGTEEGKLPMCACKRTNTLSLAGTTLGMSGLGSNGLKNANSASYGSLLADKACDKNRVLFPLTVAGLIASTCVAVTQRKARGEMVPSDAYRSYTCIPQSVPKMFMALPPSRNKLSACKLVIAGRMIELSSACPSSGVVPNKPAVKPISIRGSAYGDSQIINDELTKCASMATVVVNSF